MMSKMLARTTRLGAAGAPRALSAASLDGFGDHVFKGAVAEHFLTKQGLAPGTLDSPEWTKHPATADMVAAAVLEWSTGHGASVFCHWFQPLGASGVRHGLSGMVQNSFFKFDDAGRAVWDLSGKDLLKGETDGSSCESVSRVVPAVFRERVGPLVYSRRRVLSRRPDRPAQRCAGL